MSDAYLWKNRRRTAFDGEYFEDGSKRVMLKLDRGRFQLGFLQGFYKVLKRTPGSVELALIHGFFEQRKHPDKYRLSRRKSTYVLADSAAGTERLFKRKDEKIFLTDSFHQAKKRAKEANKGALTPEGWKMIKDSQVGYHLTGESGLGAITIPAPPRSNQPTVVRVTHSNSIGYVDSDLFVRLGSPASPLDDTDFDTVEDWEKMALVEDLRWSDNRQEWVRRRKTTTTGFIWSGTYEREMEIPKGHHMIELKLVSRVPEVCSIVLPKWKVYVR